MFELIANISFITEALPVLLYLIFQKKIQDKVLRVIVFLILAGFAFDSYSTWETSRDNGANYSILNFFTLLETLTLCFFFSKILNSKKARLSTAVLGGLFTLIWILLKFKTSFNTFDDISIAIEAIIIICLSVYYLFEQISKPQSFFLYTHPRFWVVVAYFIYMAATFFLFLFLNSLTPQEQDKYLVLNSIFLIIKTIFLSIAMLMKNTPPKPKKFELY